MTNQQPTSPDAQERRKAYHAPELEDYGEVRELTQASPWQFGATGPDGGSWPDMYTSAN